MKRRMFIFAAVFLALLVSAPWSAAPTQADPDSFTLNEKVPFGPVPVFVPCARDGEGEIVIVSGYLHQVVHIMNDATGGLHYRWSTNAAGLSGVGQTTGNKYRGTGCASQTVYLAVGHPTESWTYVDHYGLIGPGKDPKSTLRVKEKTTVDANGTLRTDFVHAEADCY